MMKPVTIRIAMLLSINLLFWGIWSSPGAANETPERREWESDSRGWNLLAQSSLAVRYVYPQGSELAYTLFLKDASFSTAKALHNDGVNLGGHVGTHEVGLTVGYGWLERFMGLVLSTGWNISLAYDYAFQGHHDVLKKQHYIGIELEGCVFHLNPSLGLKASVSHPGKSFVFIGCGLRI